MAEKSVTVGVLALHTSKETKAILNAVDDLGHEPVWLRRENIEFWLEDGITVAPDVDIVVNRLLMSTTEKPMEAIGLANIYSDARPVLNPPNAVMKAAHKFSELTDLAVNGVPVPLSYLALDSHNFNRNRSAFGDEVVYKTTIGTHGGGLWKLDAEETIGPEVGDRQMFLQEFIETGEFQYDYRIYVVDGQVIGAMKRLAPEGEWRSNIALGAEAEKADIPPKVEDIAARSTEILDLDFAGVDIMEKDGEWLVIEVNPTAGFKGLFRATGRSPAPYIARMAIEHVGGTVDPERVETVSERFDDSRPRGRPEPVEEKPKEEPVIGYIEDVMIRGTEDTKHVMAKSDTGAARTSIDLELAAEIGAGPIRRAALVRSGSAKRSRARPVVDLVVGINGSWHSVTASVEDRRHMNYQVLLGRDILEGYKVDVDQVEE